MTNQNYWTKRTAEREAHWHELTTTELTKLRRYYKAAAKELEREAATLYAKYATENGLTITEARKLIRGDEFKEWRMSLREYVAAAKGDPKLLRELNTLAMRSRISRVEAIHARTLTELIELGNRLQDTTDEHLYRAYLDNYYGTLYDFHKTVGLQTPPAAVDRPRVESVLQTKWSGKNYSARIWTNTRKVATEVQQTILQAIHRGYPIQRLSKNLAQRMNVAYTNAERLILTELNAVETRASADAMKAADFEYYQFVATLDRRTCPICGERDGEVYPLSSMNQGENAPPMHPRCRCTIIASIDDGKQGRKTTDQRAAEGRSRVPADMSYRDWQAVYIDKSKTLAQWQAQMDYKYKTDELTVAINNTKAEIARVKAVGTGTRKAKALANLYPQLEDYEAQLWRHTHGEESPYTDARRAAAYSFDRNDRSKADSYMRQTTGATWQKVTDEQRLAGYQYTCDSDKFNRPLAGFTDRRWSWSGKKGPGNVWINHEGAATMIRDLTTMIEQTKYDFDIWLNRGCGTPAMDSFFNLNQGEFQKLTSAQLKDLIGYEGTMDNFISTGTCKGTGFSNDVMIRIYAPKGTEMIYAEPFSRFGCGGQLKWDGVSQQHSFGSEFETIIQRGATYRVRNIKQTKSKTGRNTYEIELEVRIEAGYNKFQQDPAEWKGSRVDINGKKLSIADEKKGTW